MAYYSAGIRGLTPTAYADGATLTSGTYLALDAGGRAARVKEVFVGGEAVTSTVNQMAIRRHSTNATPSSLSRQKLAPFSGIPDSNGFLTDTGAGVLISPPSTLLNLTLNAFGGLVRWLAGPGEEVVIAGITAPNSQLSLTSVVGTGTISAHIIWEEL